MVEGVVAVQVEMVELDNIDLEILLGRIVVVSHKNRSHLHNLFVAKSALL